MQQGGSYIVEPCDTCGGVCFPEKIATCSKCNKAREHIYCMKILVHGIRGDWICETCQTENDTASLNMNISRDPTFDAPNDLTEHERTHLTYGFQKILRIKEHASHSLSRGGSSFREDSVEYISKHDGSSPNTSSVSPPFSGSPHHSYVASVNDAITTVEPCDTCGGVGCPEKIATCSKCNEAREHIYCMKVLVHKMHDDWICETCQNENDAVSISTNISRDPTLRLMTRSKNVAEGSVNNEERFENESDKGQEEENGSEEEGEDEEEEMKKLKMKGKAGKKRTIDSREALFRLCTARCNQDKGQEYFVDMYGYYLTRAELYCLRDRAWINDRLISMVAKTLVGEQKNSSDRMTRHIFSTEMMQKMVADPLKWSLKDNEKEILPEYIGYNIGDCELIFGPTLFHDHWFCYVLETKTMWFHTLDSLVDYTSFLRLQKPEEDTLKGKKQREFKEKDILARHCRDCFHKILRRVKPELFDKEDEIDKQVNWAKVHVQSDKNSCGVHVISWLQRWDGTVHDDAGHTMPKFSRDDLHRLRVDCLWWLVTHRNNLNSDKVLAMIEGYQNSKRKKEIHG